MPLEFTGITSLLVVVIVYSFANEDFELRGRSYDVGRWNSIHSPGEVEQNLRSRVFTCLLSWHSFQRNWLRKDLSVVGFGLIGWMAPSSLPVINGNSLTGLFLGSIGPELAHFPTGPALTSPFWYVAGIAVEHAGWSE